MNIIDVPIEIFRRNNSETALNQVERQKAAVALVDPAPLNARRVLCVIIPMGVDVGPDFNERLERTHAALVAKNVDPTPVA